MPTGHTVIGGDELTNLDVIRGSNPDLRFEETDQTDPAGRYRIRATDDTLVVQRATAASWATTYTAWSLVYDTDGVYTRITGNSTGAGSYAILEVEAEADRPVFAAFINGGTRHFAIDNGGSVLIGPSATNSAGADLTILAAQASVGIYSTTVTANAWFGLGVTNTNYFVIRTKDDGVVTITGVEIDNILTNSIDIQFQATTQFVFNNTTFIVGTGDAGTVAATGNTIRAPNITTGGAGNIAGADLTIAAGLGTGTGDVGQLIFRTPRVAATGDNLQTLTTLAIMDADAFVMQDDQRLAFGTTEDTSFVNSTAGVAANTALTGVLEGTPVTPVAIAANSLVVGNITDDADIVLAVSKAGTSHMAFMADGSTGDTLLGVPTGQSIDGYVAGVKVLDIAANLLTYEAAAGTANQVVRVANTSNAAAASHSQVWISVGGSTSTGDPALILEVLGASQWYIAADNNQSDYFMIGDGITIGTTAYFQIHRVATDTTAFSFTIPNRTTTGGANISNSKAMEVDVRTITISDTTTTSLLVTHVDIQSLTLTASGAAQVDKATGLASIPVTIAGSATLTHSSAYRALTGGVGANVSGLYVETLTGGTTGNYQALFAVSTGASPALADHVGINAKDFAVGDTRLYIQSEAGSEITLGNDTLAFAAAAILSTTAGLMVALAATPPAPDNSFLHVWAGTAGVITARNDSILVLERNAAVSLNFLTPATNSSTILFGDPTNNTLHAIETYGSSHASRANMMDFIVGGVEQMRWTNGVFNFQVATAMDLKGGYLSLTERAAPGAGAADTARIYAIVGGDTFTDLAAVFQDGTVDIFAQEVTDPNDAIVAAPDETIGTLVIKRPHPGIAQLVARVPGLGDWVISERQFHSAEKISWAVGAAGSLPADWPVETKVEMEDRLTKLAKSEA